MADQCIQPNADIAGIGTRINFYVTIVLTAIIPENDRTTELLDGLYKNAVLYGLGLVLTAGIQTLQEQLDLYHAIFVMQIIFSLDFVYAYGQRRFIRSTGGDFRMRIFIAVQTFSTVVFIAWLLYVWINDSKFGSQPECNHLVKYVLFFVNVRATETWLRFLFITYLALNSCMMLLTFGAIFMEYLHKGIQRKLQDVMVRPGAAPAGQRRTREGTPPKRVRARVYFSVIPAAYGVTTLEFIVQRNRPNIQPGEDAWGFGQIIALVLILGSAIDILVTIREWHKKRAEAPSSEEEAKSVHPPAPVMPSAPRRHFTWMPSSSSA